MGGRLNTAIGIGAVLGLAYLAFPHALKEAEKVEGVAVEATPPRILKEDDHFPQLRRSIAEEASDCVNGIDYNSLDYRSSTHTWACEPNDDNPFEMHCTGEHVSMPGIESDTKKPELTFTLDADETCSALLKRFETEAYYAIADARNDPDEERTKEETRKRLRAKLSTLLDGGADCQIGKVTKKSEGGTFEYTALKCMDGGEELSDQPENGILSAFIATDADKLELIGSPDTVESWSYHPLTWEEACRQWNDDLIQAIYRKGWVTEAKEGLIKEYLENCQ
ncbi:hypothetical protein IPG41_05310 [Candidatus Peregrinibacteria bacterium]|nr:MAG: hypothetical protein IPG41_05310 [Candidatus Peregrinibacteria bacterium]